MPEGTDEEQEKLPEKEAPEVISFKEEAIGYIEDELDQGYGLDQIKKELLEEGYPEDIINFATKYVEEHRKVSKKNKEKEVPKTDKHHHARRFHLPLLSIAVLVVALIVFFYFLGIGGEEKEPPERIDIFLYDNLGILPDVHDIAASEQVYSRDELVQENIAGSILERNKDNPLLKGLELSGAVQGFQKRATQYAVTGEGVQTKTLVEIRFQADEDIDTMKLVESVPKSLATWEEIQLTQGGLFADKDPILLFTFNNVKAGDAQKAVYVIRKEISTLDTTTFAAEQATEEEAGAEEPKVCGDGKCVKGENYRICCKDCGCPPGFTCEAGGCAPAEKDKCRKDAECDDNDASTRDTCEGNPKTCQNTPITECIYGDGYCPEGCTFEEDDDCEQTTEETSEEEVNISGLNITGEQESPDISDLETSPVNLSIGEEMLIEATVTDTNGKDDIDRVWYEILELAQTHGEIGDMNDLGSDGDKKAGDNIYTATNEIEEFYLTGFYHVTVYAEDRAGNRKKSQTTFIVS